MSDSNKVSYSQILKSSAIVGGGQGIDLLIRMARTKVVAVLLGPSGIGLIGIYQAAIELAGKLSGLGIRSSAVRQVAEAHGNKDIERLGRTVKALQRTCWISGMLGWLLMVILAKPLSIWLFGSSEKAWGLVIIGAVLLFENISGGQTALIQGSRRIKDLAIVSIFSSLGSTLVSISLYAWLGEKGIVSAILASSAINLIFAWWFSHRIIIHKPIMKWGEIANEALPLLVLGLAFMWNGILSAGVDFVTRSLVVRDYGIIASGIYQAGWGISGLFAGFVLNAMGQDFYPRLTAVARDNKLINQMVNEQTEIGILLSLPGLLATLAFSPLVIQIFYTSEFVPAVELLNWFIFGIFGRVIAWPAGYIQLAKGASRIFAATETTFCIYHMFFIWAGLKLIGIKGIAVAFAIAYACHLVISLLVADRLTGFKWSKSSLKLMGVSICFLIIQLSILKLSTGIFTDILSILIVSCSSIYCMRELIVRLGPAHRISKFVSSVPWVSRLVKG